MSEVAGALGAGGGVTTAFPHSFGKRLVAVAVGICAIGVGHYYLGAGRAGAAWAASIMAAALAAIAGMLLGLPRVAFVGLVLSVAVQLVGLVDLLRTRSTPSPPTARVAGLALIVTGLGLGFRMLVRDQLVEAFGIPGQSMSPTLVSGDQILVSKLQRSPARGDVIVFKTPDGDSYVKRVVAVGGDTIEMREGAVWLNEKELPQTPDTAPCRIEDPCKLLQETNDGRTYRVAVTESPMLSIGKMGPREIPQGHVFVLGDGRDWSNDSRREGPIPLDRVVGTLTFVWWPVERFGLK